MADARGQASVELVAALPALLLAALVALQLLAAGYALTLADGAAEAGALALASGGSAADAARGALPGWAKDDVAVAVRGRRGHACGCARPRLCARSPTARRNQLGQREAGAMTRWPSRQMRRPSWSPRWARPRGRAAPPPRWPAPGLTSTWPPFWSTWADGPPRPTLLASAAAHRLEERLVAHLPRARVAARGQVCHLAVPAEPEGFEVGIGGGDGGARCARGPAPAAAAAAADARRRARPPSLPASCCAPISPPIVPCLPSPPAI